MKKFFSGVKKNIFYISLITGMAVLVAVLGLYNAKTNPKEKTIEIGQNTPYEDTSETGAKTKETLSGKDKTAVTETSENTENELQNGLQDGTDADDTETADNEDTENMNSENAQSCDSEDASAATMAA